MMATKYVKIQKSVTDFGQLVKPEDIKKFMKNDSDYYASTYYYNENQYKEFKKNGSTSGIKDVTTDMIWWDFDDAKNPGNAQKDSLELVTRLKTININPEKVQIYFSGNKGFHVIINVKNELNPTQVKTIANRFASDLTTFDTSLYDTAQILRIPYTKHQESGLYKIPLTYNQLKGFTMEQIKTTAKDKKAIGAFDYETFDLSEDLLKVEEKKEIQKVEEKLFDTKPHYWKPNLWAMIQGEMPAGTRDECCLRLAAACRGLGYDEETAVALIVSALKRAIKKYGEGTTSLEDAEAKARRAYNQDTLETNAEEFDPTYGIMSLKELYNQPDVKTPYLVENLLPLSGTSILAGAPKEGKSTLVRNLITAITNGEKFLNWKAMKGPVLYFALEENIGETKKNFQKLKASNSEQVHLAFSNHGVKGVDELELIIDKFKPVLVVVDTLFHFISMSNGNDYVEVNNKLKPFTNLARTKNVHIMFVHHTNKSEIMTDRSILGSQAIAGIVDSILLFKAFGKQRVLSGKTRNNGPLEEIYLDHDAETNSYTIGDPNDWDLEKK